jgi:type II secretory pathway component GspD/PulD (secretin)
MNAVKMFAGIALALMLFAPGAGAQTEPADSKPAEPKPTPETYHIFYLTNLTQPNEIQDFQTALRNMLSPKARVYAMMPENAITLRGTPEDIQLAQKILSDLDRAMSIYRLTYTITESDGGKRVGTRRFALVVATGQRVDFKQGSRVPLVTGVADATTSKTSSQVQYVDVGLSITANVDRYADGLRLRTKVEQSSLAEEKSGVGAQDPVIRQSMLEGTSTLELGKPLLLGSFDLPGGTRKQEVEVVAELVR